LEVRRQEGWGGWSYADRTINHRWAHQNALSLELRSHQRLLRVTIVHLACVPAICKLAAIPRHTGRGGGERTGVCMGERRTGGGVGRAGQYRKMLSVSCTTRQPELTQSMSGWVDVHIGALVSLHVPVALFIWSM